MYIIIILYIYIYIYIYIQESLGKVRVKFKLYIVCHQKTHLFFICKISFHE